MNWQPCNWILDDIPSGDEIKEPVFCKNKNASLYDEPSWKENNQRLNSSKRPEVPTIPVIEWGDTNLKEKIKSSRVGDLEC